MSWQHFRGLKVKPGQYVECVRLGKINKLSLGKRYKVRDRDGRWFRNGYKWDSPSIRIYLECDDGLVRSFNTWNFKISDNQAEANL